MSSKNFKYINFTFVFTSLEEVNEQNISDYIKKIENLLNKKKLTMKITHLKFSGLDVSFISVSVYVYIFLSN